MGFKISNSYFKNIRKKEINTEGALFHTEPYDYFIASGGAGGYAGNWDGDTGNIFISNNMPTTLATVKSITGYTTVVYVDLQNGDDTNGDGTSGNPYKTITHAANIQASGSSFIIDILYPYSIYETAAFTNTTAHIAIYTEDGDPAIIRSCNVYGPNIELFHMISHIDGSQTSFEYKSIYWGVVYSPTNNTSVSFRIIENVYWTYIHQNTVLTLNFGTADQVTKCNFFHSYVSLENTVLKSGFVEKTAFIFHSGGNITFTKKSAYIITNAKIIKKNYDVNWGTIIDLFGLIYKNDATSVSLSDVSVGDLYSYNIIPVSTIYFNADFSTIFKTFDLRNYHYFYIDKKPIIDIDLQNYQISINERISNSNETQINNSYQQTGKRNLVIDVSTTLDYQNTNELINKLSYNELYLTDNPDGTWQNSINGIGTQIFNRLFVDEIKLMVGMVFSDYESSAGSKYIIGKYDEIDGSYSIVNLKDEQYFTFQSGPGHSDTTTQTFNFDQFLVRLINIAKERVSKNLYKIKLTFSVVDLNTEEEVAYLNKFLVEQ